MFFNFRTVPTSYILNVRTIVTEKFLNVGTGPTVNQFKGFIFSFSVEGGNGPLQMGGMGA